VGGDGMFRKASHLNKEIREDQAGVHRPSGREEPPCGSQRVHSSDEAGNDRGAKGHREMDA
jgi:hypothetical protein